MKLSCSSKRLDEGTCSQLECVDPALKQINVLIRLGGLYENGPTVKRSAAIGRILVLGLTLLVAAGGVGLYFFTSMPSNGNVATPSGFNAVRVLTNQGSAGYMVVQYNGSSYQVAAKGGNAPSFACPVGTDPALCNLLRATCGNGVGPGQEPWKNCTNCAFDAGCTGQQSCDPYTHQCSVFVGACQVAVYGGA